MIVSFSHAFLCVSLEWRERESQRLFVHHVSKSDWSSLRNAGILNQALVYFVLQSLAYINNVTVIDFIHAAGNPDLKEYWHSLDQKFDNVEAIFLRE